MASRPAPMIAWVAAVLVLLAACTPADPPAQPSQVYEEGGSARWYRGNLHTHTLWSDGNELPEAVVDWYRNNGYHFLAITEHDLAPGDEGWVAASRRPATMAGLDGSLAPERRDGDHVEELRLKPLHELQTTFDAPGRFLLLPGEEISDAVGPVSVHVNAVNLATTIQPARAASVDATIAADFAAIAAQAKTEGRDILAQLNHPNFTYSITAEHLMRLPGVAFFEAYNGHPLSNNPGDGLRMSTESAWDVALAWRLDVLGLPMLYATATDDSHHYQPGGDASPGRGWIEVLSPALSPDALFDAMREGRFYASTGVRLKRIVATADRMEVEVEPEAGTQYTIEFIGTRRGFDTTATPPASATDRPIYASHRYDPKIGSVLSRQQGTSAIHRFDDDDLYVRARITATRAHHDPSQPLQFAQAWVQPIVGPAGHAPSRRDLAPPAPPPPALHRGITRRFQALDKDEATRWLSRPRIPCSVDTLSDARGISWPAYPSRGSAAFSGWIADPGTGRVPGSFAIVLEGARHYMVEDGPGRRRVDVANHFGNPAFEAAGFHASFELADVAAGEYRIWLLGFDRGNATVCDSGKTLQVE